MCANLPIEHFQEYPSSLVHHGVRNKPSVCHTVRCPTYFVRSFSSGNKRKCRSLASIQPDDALAGVHCQYTNVPKYRIWGVTHTLTVRSNLTSFVTFLVKRIAPQTTRLCRSIQGTHCNLPREWISSRVTARNVDIDNIPRRI